MCRRGVEDTPMEPCPFKDDIAAFRTALARLPGMDAKLDALKDDTLEVKKALFGNGKPSLPTEIAVLKERSRNNAAEIAELKQCKERDQQFRRRVIVAIIGAVLTALIPGVVALVVIAQQHGGLP